MKLSTLLVLSAFVATFCVLQAEARVGERRLGWMDGWARHYAAGGPTPGRMAEIGRYVKMALDEDDDIGGWKFRNRHPLAGPRGFTAGRGWDEDDSVGHWTDHFRHIGSYGHGMGGVAGHWDEDDEAKTCSASNYERQITATMQSFNPEHFKPPSKPPSEACIRAVFNKEWDKLCSECKEDTECYGIKGSEAFGRVHLETPQCYSYLRGLGQLSSGNVAVPSCSASNYVRQITAAKKYDFKPPSAACTRAVFQKLCSECKEDTECYLRGGAEVARETPQCMSNRRRLGWKWRPRHPKAGPRGFTAGRGWDQDDDLGYGYGRFL